MKGCVVAASNFTAASTSLKAVFVFRLVRSAMFFRHVVLKGRLKLVPTCNQFNSI